MNENFEWLSMYLCKTKTFETGKQANFARAAAAYVREERSFAMGT